MLANISKTTRSTLSRVTAPRCIARQHRFKTGKTGEEGQFKSVTASQSSHEPTHNKTSKPPHKASRADVRHETPTQLEPENVHPAQKKKNAGPSS